MDGLLDRSLICVSRPSENDTDRSFRLQRNVGSRFSDYDLYLGKELGPGGWIAFMTEAQWCTANECPNWSFDRIHWETEFEWGKNDILRTKIFLQSSLRFWPEWSGCDGNFSWPLDHLHIPVHAATLLGHIICFNFQTFSTIFVTSPSYDINLYIFTGIQIINHHINGVSPARQLCIHWLSTKRCASTAGWMQGMSQWTSARRAHQIHLQF